ncbi:unnamed protein product [Owenia fusiformis]|uniref:Protein max n=1 Tax=Owenia fusiformis TaxID=6347 RepID=A0A8J1U367_OWEFU|nr:unnamed protein product [Owenia fusiformis]
MSDDDRDVDIESDEDDLGSGLYSSANTQFMTQEEKRAHHNALERKRRDHIKESFSSLRDSVPSLQGEKASRAQILKQASDYIQFMTRKNTTHQQDIDDLRRQNSILENQVRGLEKTKNVSSFAQSTSKEVTISTSESSEDEPQGRARKKQKTK